MDVPSAAFSLQPDARLIALAIALAVVASFVSLSLFHHAAQGDPRRRLGWLVLAALSGAFGIWVAHVVAMLSHNVNAVRELELLLTVASLLGVVAITFTGFTIAARGARWHAPVAGAINGTGMSVMHYVGIYALAVPGVLEWDLPLVAASIGLSVGLNSAALTAYRWLKGTPGLLCGAALLTLGFFALHFTAINAVHLSSAPLFTVEEIAAHHWLLAVIVVATALLILLVGLLSTFIDRQAVNDNVELTQQLVDAAIEGIAVVKDGRILSVNRRLAELCRTRTHDLVGAHITGNLFADQIADGEARESCMRAADGASVPVKVVHQRLSSGDEVYAVHDLSERRAAEAELQRRNTVLQQREEELRARNLQFDTALRHMSQALCMYDENERLVVCNERYATIYGLPPDALKPGMSRHEIIEMRIARGLWAGASPEAYREERMRPVSAANYFVQEMCDGRCIALRHVPMPGGGWVCTHEDITEQRQAQAKIAHLARHDGLTDLPNRVLLRERLQEALSRLRPDEGLAVHCLDLDRFKEVNDALGHAVGDELLQEFGRRLSKAVGNTGIVARSGGDEFVVVQEEAAAPRDAIDLAADVIAAMHEPFMLGDHFQVVLSASIGIAMAPGDGTDAEELLKNANIALSRAKEEERGKYRFFEREMDARVRARHELERNLRGALANDELDVHFQPLLNLKRNEISCFEALLRWRTRAGEAIEPGEFIPLAEETGLILPLGEWVLRQALAEAAKWPRQIRVAVNLSPMQFHAENLSQVVMSALAASGVEPSRLELEITESLLLQDRESTFTTLHRLRDLGVRIALDDFGTGFSSLNYLRSFPFDKLKIDRCFIAGLAEGNEESLAIVRAVARLGKSLGIATTAEGVETKQQMETARKEGFTEIQGFWLSVPKSASEIAEEYELYKRSRRPRRAAAATLKAEPVEDAPAPAGAPTIRVRAKKTRRTRGGRSGRASG